MQQQSPFYLAIVILNLMLVTMNVVTGMVILPYMNTKY